MGENSKFVYDIDYIVSGDSFVRARPSDFLEFHLDPDSENRDDILKAIAFHAKHRTDIGSLLQVECEPDFNETDLSVNLQGDNSVCYTFSGIARCHVALSAPLPKELVSNIVSSQGQELGADELPIPEQDKQTIKNAFHAQDLGILKNEYPKFYIDAIMPGDAKTRFMDAFNQYQDFLLARGFDLSTVNEQITETMRVANAAHKSMTK